MNMLTGARFSDISPASQDAKMREMVTEFLKQFPDTRVLKRPYIPTEDLEGMSPRARAAADLGLNELRSLGIRAKQRAAASP